MMQKQLVVRPALFIMLLALLLSGCGGVPAVSTPVTTGVPVNTVLPASTTALPPATQPSRPTSGVVISTAVPGPTLGALPTAGPAVSPTPMATKPVVLNIVHMITAQEGWGQSNDQLILRTSDGGATWQTAPLQVNGPAMPFFLDANNAWVAISAVQAGQPTIQVARTSDGGQSWTEAVVEAASLVPGAMPGPLSFIDAQHGWMEVGLGVGAGSEGVAILRTTDGGATWQEMSVTAGAQGETPNGLPLSCIKSGLVFIDENTGWAPGSCAGGPIFFFKTTDGGATWARQQLPTGVDVECQCSVSLPQFVSPQVGTVLASDPAAQAPYTLFRTTDGGVTWTGVGLPVSRLFGRPVFVDANTGWLTDGAQLYATQDGGQSWNPIGAWPSAGLAGDMDFIDAQNGWFTDALDLYRTADGGRTWTSLRPVAVSTAGPGEEQTVTLDNTGQTITLPVGQRFLLFLGEGYTWTVTVADESIVSRVPNVLTVRGSQGLYEAHRSGQTTLQASGDPLCRGATPPCEMPSREFQIDIVVP